MTGRDKDTKGQRDKENTEYLRLGTAEQGIMNVEVKKTEDRRQKTEDTRLKTQDLRHKTEDSRHKTEDRRLKTEYRGHYCEGGGGGVFRNRKMFIKRFLLIRICVTNSYGPMLLGSMSIVIFFSPQSS